MDLIKKMVSSFQRLNKLQTLVVRFDKYGEGWHDVILEVPWCSASLRTLVLQMNPISRVPNWMKSLDNMEYLYMTIKKLDQESHCILGVLPVLVDLQSVRLVLAGWLGWSAPSHGHYSFEPASSISLSHKRTSNDTNQPTEQARFSSFVVFG